MTDPKTITLVVVSDDHYIILVAALIKSAEANLARGAKLDIWVVSDAISDENKHKAASCIDKDITTLHWKDIKDIVPSGLRLPTDWSSYPLNIYARLFIPYFIPADTEKVLYLDADMIVQNDLSVLWHTDISQHTVGAVLDPRLKTFDNHWGGILNYKQLGFAGNTPYFNTGLLLINTAKWRNDNTTEQILDVINHNKKYANYPDQYGMNIVLHNQWLALDERWNHFATDPTGTPYIIHFVERKPIYSTYKNSAAYQQIFYKYLDNTPWKEVQPVGEGRRYIKKLKNIIAKFRQS